MPEDLGDAMRYSAFDASPNHPKSFKFERRFQILDNVQGARIENNVPIRLIEILNSFSVGTVRGRS